MGQSGCSPRAFPFFRLRPVGCESESDRTRYRDDEMPVRPMSPVWEYFAEASARITATPADASTQLARPRSRGLPVDDGNPRFFLPRCIMVHR